MQGIPFWVRKGTEILIEGGCFEGFRDDFYLVFYQIPIDLFHRVGININHLSVRVLTFSMNLGVLPYPQPTVAFGKF